MKTLIFSSQSVFFGYLSFLFFHVKWFVSTIKNSFVMESKPLESSSNLDIGHAIRSIRRKRNLSQEQLAKLSGISQGFISYIEKGVKTPTIEILERIAYALSVPLHLLIYKAKGRSKSELIYDNPQYADFLSLMFDNFDLATDLFLLASQNLDESKVEPKNFVNKGALNLEELENELISFNKEVKDLNCSLRKSLIGREGELLSTS